MPMDNMLYLWLLLAAVTVFVELATTAFAALCFTLGALIGALLAGVGLSLPWQLVGLCIGTLVGFVALRPLLKRYLYHGKDVDKVPTNADALIGRTAVVTEAIEPATQQGQVKTDGDVWMARSLHGQTIAVGTPVRIVQRESIVMYVEPLF